MKKKLVSCISPVHFGLFMIQKQNLKLFCVIVNFVPKIN